MSGPEDMARLTVTIDTANELFLSDEIKMMDVGNGVMRPTNAKAIADLAVQMNGALIYTSTALGLAGTPSAGYFSVINPLSTEYLTLYRNDAGAAIKIKDYPSSEAVTVARSAAETALGLAQPRMISDEMAWAVVDAAGQPILGVKSNGVAHAVLDKMPGLDMISEYAWAIVDNDGFVLIGIKWTGELVVYGQAAASVTAYADGPVGAQDIFVLVGGVTYQITSSGSNFSPAAGSGQVTYINRAGAVTTVTATLPVVGSVAPFVSKFKHLVSYGQSLAMGAMSVIATTQPPVANRLFTLNSGVRLAEQDDTLTAAMVAPFKPMVANTTETPCVQLAAQLNRIRGIPKDSAMLVSCHGRGGYTIAQLSKGTLYYSNMMTAITAAKAECDRLGMGYEVPFMHFRQGEANREAAAGYYYGMLRQLQTDFETDAKSITGQAGHIPIIIEQLSNITSYAGYTTSNVIFEELQVSQDFPDLFICSGPSYHLEHAVDGTHMMAPEYMRLGCGDARAAKGVLGGGRFIPVSATSARRLGNKVLLDFCVPFPPLVIDTVNVLDPGSYGFRWVDSTNSATVAGVRLIGDSRLELTLSNVPTGTGAYVGIADIGTAGAWGGPATGMRTNLRDSSSDMDGFGVPVLNWACHQRISVTTEA